MSIKKITSILLCLSAILLPNICLAQISYGGTPLSFMNGVLQGNSRLKQKTFVLPEINNQEQLRKAKRIADECATCKKEYYGTGIDVSLDIKREGIIHEIANGKLWLLTVTSTSALGMQFYFNRFRIPEKSTLFIFNEDKTMILGSFTSKNNYEDNKFATQVIEGKSITLEYFEPNNSPFEGELNIYKIIHAFKDGYPTKTNFYGESGDCNVDINCPTGANYQDVKGGICRISFYDNSSNLSAWCSGALINSTSSSRLHLVLTANHCLAPEPLTENQRQYRVSEWIFEFGYEIADCNNKQDPFIINKTIQGASILSRGSLSDYALLELSTSFIPDSYNVAYLGWDRTDGVIPAKAVGIHHPSGDVKKISLDNDPIAAVYTMQLVGGGFKEERGAPLTDWKINWNVGITEGGSSGSPLLNPNKQIIGQLRGGSSECPSTFGPDFYGRLAVSWNNPDPGYLSWPLSHWLDYNNTGTKSLSSYNPASDIPSCSNGIKDGSEMGVDCGEVCKPCLNLCQNGIQDNGESGVDCGGACHSCPEASCTNGIKDGEETDVDCGGSRCPPCSISTLDPAVVLGNFNYSTGCFGDCKLLNESCQTEGWRMNYGSSLLGFGVDGNHHLVMLSQATNYSSYYGSGLYKNYIFVKGKKYLMSFKLLTGRYYPSDYTGTKEHVAIPSFQMRLTSSIASDRNVCFGNGTDPYWYYQFGGSSYRFPAQFIFALSNYKNDFNQGKDWQTVVIEFTPDDNYNQLWLTSNQFSEYPNGPAPLAYLRIDDIFLYERETFFNPCCENGLTITNVNELLLNPTANYLITVAGNGNSIILNEGQSASIVAREIIIKDNFNALPGSSFTARAGYCPKNILTNTQSQPFVPFTSSGGSLNLKSTPITSNSYLESCVLPQNKALTDSSDFGRLYFDDERLSEEVTTGTAIELYPNPSTGVFNLNITFSESKLNIQATIVNSLGVPVYDRSFRAVNSISEVIELGNKEAGVYLLIVRVDDEILYRKMVKK